MSRSTRTRVKSQRALESEDSNRLLAQAKKAQLDAESGEGDVAIAESSTAAAKRTRPKKKAVPGKGKSRKTKGEEEVWCICRTSEGDTPMIECGVCNDWFHFSCIDMDPSEADQIHKYVCPNCAEATGEKTTRVTDISNLKSPSPPPGVVKPTGKRKQPVSKSKLKVEEVSDNPSESDSSDDDDASSASHSDSSGSTSRPRNRSSKKARTIPTRSNVKEEPAPKPVVERKPSLVARKSSTTKIGELPAARTFVLSKFTGVVKDLFPDMQEEDVQRYVVEAESSLWRGFKEVKDGKDVAGARYKTQFNLLTSSLNSSLRTDTYNAITSRQLKPSGVALLTSAELASQDRWLELEKAKEEALRQTVKVKDMTEPKDIRLGRDGFEKVEDAREKELSRLAEAEEEARERERRRKEEEARAAEEAAAAEKAGSVSATPTAPVSSEGMKPPSHRKSMSSLASPSLPKSPTVAQHPLGPRRSESREDVAQSPRNSISLTSAWGGARDASEERPREERESLSFSADQTLDLSDIVAEPEDVDMAPAEPAQDEAADFEKKEVVWSGIINNPTDKSTTKATVEARLIARPPPPPTSPWSLLIHTPSIEIVGRVPVKTSLDFIRASRLNPNRELFTVAFSPTSSSTPEQLAAWNETIDFFIQKDRHAVCHLYGKVVPRNAIQELYLFPLRPEDSSPDVTDLLDGYSLPSKRKHPVMVGVFIGHKENLHHPTYTTPPVSAPAPAPIARAPPPIATIPNLDSGMLSSLLALTGNGQGMPGAPTGPAAPPYPASYAPPQGLYPPAQPSGYNASLYNYPSGPSHNQGGHSPYDMPRGNASPYDQRGGGSPYDQHRNEQGWNRGQQGRGQERFRGMERDNGWGSRQ